MRRRVAAFKAASCRRTPNYDQRANSYLDVHLAKHSPSQTGSATLAETGTGHSGWLEICLLGLLYINGIGEDSGVGEEAAISWIAERNQVPVLGF